MKSLCIYHGNCADGFTAAWVVRKALNDVEFHPGVYQNDPPLVDGRDIVMVDFSYKRPIMEKIVRAARTVLVLDHHKTAEEDLRGLAESFAIEGNREGSAEVVFDMERSGARIAWDYYFDSDPPPLLLHVEDRDLWRFKLPRTREIQACVFSYPYEFDVWDRLMASDMEELAAQGEAIERKHFKDVRELVGVVTREMKIGGYHVPIANLPYTLTSDAGHLLTENHPFAGCYWDTPEGRVFSLRSRPEGVDVSEVAKHYGGGGHRNAAGFRLSFVEAEKLEVKE